MNIFIHCQAVAKTILILDGYNYWWNSGLSILLSMEFVSDHLQFCGNFVKLKHTEKHCTTKSDHRVFSVRIVLKRKTSRQIFRYNTVALQ